MDRKRRVEIITEGLRQCKSIGPSFAERAYDYGKEGGFARRSVVYDECNKRF